MDFDRTVIQAPEVVLIDGLWGSGKSLIAPFASSLKGVGPYRIDSTTEVLTAILAEGKISPDAYKFFVLNAVIENYFGAAIGREVNLRPGDDSSFFRFLGLFEVLRRLLSKGSDETFDSHLRAGQPYLQMTHLLSFVSPELFQVFPEGFRIVTVRRNPAFMVEHWRTFLEKFDRPRELTLAARFEGVKVPFFAMSWPEEWCRASFTERALLSIARCSVMEEENLDSLSKYPEVSHVIYLSDFLARPEKNLSDLEVFVGRNRSSASGRLLRSVEKAGAGPRSARRQKSRPETSEGADVRILDKLRAESSGLVFQEFEESVFRYRKRENAQRQQV
jgi:hypothetical protein